MADLKSDLKRYLVEDLHLEDVAPEDIGDDDAIFGDGLGLDSLDAVELVVLLQKRFGVLVKDMAEAKDAFATVNTLAAFIEARRDG